MLPRSIAIASLLCAAASAQRSPVSWNTWASTSAGTILTGSGPVDVTFAGDALGLVKGVPNYLPADTWADGSTLFNPPVSANGTLQLTGGSPNVQTLSFSAPVHDPVIAIWSLGTPTVFSSFRFLDATPVLVSGGPNEEYGGESISVVGMSVTGFEGNGSVQFRGTYTSISWTNPDYEGWYGFNVGLPDVAPAWSIVGQGVAGINETPTLVGAGTLTMGSAGNLALASAAPGATALLFVSPVSVPTPFLCGTLVPVPFSMQVPCLLSGSGSTLLAWPTWPSGLSGSSLYFQCVIPDASTECGVSISNALRADVP